MRIAKQLYFEQNKGHTFKDEAAWEKLRHAPKWSQQSSGSSSTIDFNKSFDHQQQQQSEGSIAVRPSSMTPMNYHQIGTSHQSRSEEPRRLKRRAEDDGSEDLLIDEMTQQIIDQSNSWLSTFERGSLKRSNTSTVSDEKSRIMKESVISEMEFKKSQCQLNDLAILKTSESDCPDEISKEALRLMKIRIKKRYEQDETLIE
ncbi:hypothetical protein PPACK8108_LOCUS6287 [Phakopsora pachyrhizi]|uniref:No apical meristem-associated C-terminal domain-containing protein n=1 Tax=Phakopsora pachyrhizi TaxID=170000 RepID=A0AAV0ATF8_PHAPC|nr:hypothetical protein PPACK8108_LOCUS6287 [Phakopsora pachyrhizi]